MTTVAFLQNQWFRDPSKVRRTFEEHPDRHEQLVAAFLFRGCTTGRRLKAAFGEDIENIIWENVSKEIGDKSSSKFPADREHITAVLDKFKPSIVIGFGAVAVSALIPMITPDNSWQLMCTIHPAKRGADTMTVLKRIAQQWRSLNGSRH